MSNIIYCNSCFEIKSQQHEKFFLTSCCHVFCNVCMATDRSVCKLCNIQCRVLEISKNMPPDVIIMFKSDSVAKLVATIKKIRSFQENQVKLYVDKMKSKVEEYPKYKLYIQKLCAIKKNHSEAIKKEKEMIERLKVAYKTNKITPDLFEFTGKLTNDGGNTQSNRKGSDASMTSSRSGRTSNDSRSFRSSREGSATSSAATLSRAPTIQNNASRVPLTPLNRGNHSDLNPTPSRSRAPLLSGLMQKYHLSGSSNQPSTPSYLKVTSRLTPYPPTQSSRSSTSSPASKRPNIIQSTPRLQQYQKEQLPPSIVERARETLLQNTLRQMNADSQMKYQAMRRQQKKF